MRGKRIPNVLQNFRPVSADFFRMEAEHGIAVVGVLATAIEDRLARLEIDAWHKDF